MRVDLNEFQNGAYAELRDLPPWAFMKETNKLAGKEELEPDDVQALSDAYLKHFVREWNVKDLDGNDAPIPLKAQDGQLDYVDGRILVKLVQEARQVNTSVKLEPNSESAS